MRILKKLFKIKRGFTLMECVLAMTLLAITCSVILPSLSTSYNSINGTQNFDTFVAVAEKYATSVPLVAVGEEIDTSAHTDADGYTHRYVTGFNVKMQFEIKTSGVNEIAYPVRYYKMVATVVNDEDNNYVVFYDIDPNELVNIFEK